MITRDDIISVAERFGITLSEDIIETILLNYDDYQDPNRLPEDTIRYMMFTYLSF